MHNRFYIHIILNIIIFGSTEVLASHSLFLYSATVTATKAVVAFLHPLLLSVAVSDFHMCHAVDGRHPAPVDMVNIPFHNLQGFIRVGWCRFFFHQQ